MSAEWLVRCRSSVEQILEDVVHEASRESDRLYSIVD